jgi:hypothetical protein
VAQCQQIAHIQQVKTKLVYPQRLANGDRGGTAGLVSLRGDGHVVVVAEIEALGRPGVEVVARGDWTVTDRQFGDM